MNLFYQNKIFYAFNIIVYIIKCDNIIQYHIVYYGDLVKLIIKHCREYNIIILEHCFIIHVSHYTVLQTILIYRHYNIMLVFCDIATGYI